MLRVGIIGLGFMGSAHVKAWLQASGARIAALCNPSGRNLDGDFSKVFGNVGDTSPLRLDMQDIAAYQDFSQMLADSRIDAVDICAPTHTHRELALAALAAGKHVLCEKPMARTAADARLMAEAARKAQRILMPAMCLRFWPEWAWLKEAVGSGRYGRVLSARFTRLAEPPAWSQTTFLDGKKSGGGLLDLHIHDTDFVQFLFGRPLAVESAGYSRVSGCIDHVVTRYEVTGGALVHAEGSWAMSMGFGFRMAYTVNFENATADYDLVRAKDALKLSANGSTEIITPGGPGGYAREIQHFVDSIIYKSQPAVVTAEDGASAIEICEAELRSIAQQCRIRLD